MSTQHPLRSIHVHSGKIPSSVDDVHVGMYTSGRGPKKVHLSASIFFLVKLESEEKRDPSLSSSIWWIWWWCISYWDGQELVNLSTYLVYLNCAATYTYCFVPHMCMARELSPEQAAALRELHVELGHHHRNTSSYLCLLQVLQSFYHPIYIVHFYNGSQTSSCCSITSWTVR